MQVEAAAILEDEPLPQYPEPHNAEKYGVIKDNESNKMRHRHIGRPVSVDEGAINGFLACVEEVRQW
jgi:hypothetical protein